MSILSPSFRLRVLRCTLLGLGLSNGSLWSTGCASDTTGPAPLNPAQAYWYLTLNHHAITLALTPPYNTLQLGVTLSSATGTPLSDTGVTTWTTSDTSVQVSATGLLTAVAPATGVQITAKHTIGPVTNSDSVIVNVNPATGTPVPSFAKLTLTENFTATDSLRLTLYGLRTFTTAALDPSGDTIPNVVVQVHSADSAILKNLSLSVIEGGRTGVFRDYAVGHTVLIAEATVYGVSRADTLPITVGWWQNILVGVVPRTVAGSRTPIGTFIPQDDTVAVGGTVAWKNELSGQSIDVVFDDSAAAHAVDSATFLEGAAANFQLVIPAQGGGNIPAFAPVDTGALGGEDGVGVRARQFPLAGMYRYHSALYGTTGVIHVVPAFQVP